MAYTHVYKKLYQIFISHETSILMSELVAREQAGLSEAQRKAQQTKNLQAEIERLRKEGSSLLEREQALLREELAKQARLAAENKQTATTGLSQYSHLYYCYV